MNKPLDFLSKYQKLFLAAALFLGFSAVSVSFSKGEVHLNFQNYPFLILALVAISISLALIYVSIDKQKIRKLSTEIAKISKENNHGKLPQRIALLTPRQEKVYKLIIAGRSNKEIMSVLFIEQSTLKSHINQIYKKLEVKNRRELKAGSIG